MLLLSIFFFFFKQKTAYEITHSDWSSDVCSSDLSRDRRRCPAGAYAVATPPHARERRVKPLRAIASVLLLSSAVATAAAKPPATAPTRKDDVVDRLHGVDVADPYRWLEDSDAPEVQAWTDAQNAATRRALDRVPGRAALEQRLWQLYEIGYVGVPVSRAIAPSATAARRYFYTRRDGKQNQP